MKHSFKTVIDAVVWSESDRIIAASELLFRSQEKYMSLYRCRTCGALWAEACYTSGQMDVLYLYPAPPVEDPIRWLLEEAEGLPSR